LLEFRAFDDRVVLEHLRATIEPVNLRMLGGGSAAASRID
jgi:hypothetical protein